MGKIKKDSLGDRQKQYEKVQEHYLVPKMPFIIRVDGKAFHTYTRCFRKPFDDVMGSAMKRTMKSLCKDIPGAVFGYTQSDEITIICKYTDRIRSQAWFGGRVEKLISITASKATKYFNKYFSEEVESQMMSIGDTKLLSAYIKKVGEAEFDSRVFNLPEWDCINNIIWRQQDAIRNSIEAVGQANFSAKELHKVNCEIIKEKLRTEKGIDWETDFTRYQKYGAVCIKVIQDKTSSTDDTYKRKTWEIDCFVVEHDRECFSKLTGLEED